MAAAPARARADYDYLIKLLLISDSATDMLRSNQSLRDSEMLVSSGQYFKLGFFSPVNSSYRYVGIMYNTIPEMTVIWVANREKPLNDLNGSLQISGDGNLVILNGKKEIVWSSNISGSVVNLNAQSTLGYRESGVTRSFEW